MTVNLRVGDPFPDMELPDHNGKRSRLRCFTRPGAGYRTLRPGTRVAFEVVDGQRGPTARNIQRQDDRDREPLSP